MAFVFVLIASSFATKVVEYKFWKNYGKVFFDYSLNGRHAINGLFLANATQIATMTDRGLFMEEYKSIKLPPNELSQTFTLPNPVTILFWISMNNSIGQIFVRYCNSYLIGIHRHNSTTFHLWAFQGQSLYSQNPSLISTCIFYLDKWMLLSYEISQNTLTFRSNDYIHYKNPLSKAIDLTQPCQNSTIGFNVHPSIKFFMWNFLIVPGANQHLNYINFTNSNTCYLGTCSCNPSMNLEDLGIGCVPNSSNISQNAQGQVCSKSPCKGSVYLNCLCPSESCSLDLSGKAECIDYLNNLSLQITADCQGTGQGCCATGCSCTKNQECLNCYDWNSSYKTTNCTCNEGFYNYKIFYGVYLQCAKCLDECRTCLSGNNCTSCIEPLAKLDAFQRCKCIPGYYSETSTVVSNSCKPCPVECTECLSKTVCLKCVSGSPVNQRCLCIDGYFLNKPNQLGFYSDKDECLSCIYECKTCKYPLNCTSCKDYNSYLDEFGRCKCFNGFYASYLKGFECLSCLEECETCEDFFGCTSCKNVNMSLNQTGRCECSKGFYDSGVEGIECFSCLNECETCRNSLNCTSCLAENSYLDESGRCKCSKGFYSDDSENFTCLSCLEECETCQNSQNCTSCKAENSYLDEIGRCKCSKGFYSDDSENFTCLSCLKECETCQNSQNCTSCKTENSYLDETGRCKCFEGFYNKFSDILTCQSCSIECETCQSQSKCTKCKFSNTFLDKNGKCRCLKGYYPDSQLPSNQCLKCQDDCDDCTSFDNCTECRLKNSVIVNGVCKCFQGYYLRNNKDCKACPKTCLSCIEDISITQGVVCSSCQEGYKLKNGYCDPVCGKYQRFYNHSCVCDIGYQMSETECLPSFFYLNIKVSKSNRLLLKFTSALNESLKLSNISVHLPIKKSSFKFLSLSNSKYMIIPSFKDHVKEGSILNLNFKNHLLSISNEVLFSLEYKVKLFKMDYIDEDIKSVISKSKSVNQVGGSTSISISFISNPSAAWALLNTIQVISFLPLAKDALTPVMTQYCTSIGSFGMIPNLLEDFLDKNLSEPPYQQAQIIGIETSVFLLNIATDLTVLIVFLCFLPFIYLATSMNLGKFSKKFEEKLHEYRYDVFIRFWIQSYLSFGVFAIISSQSVIIKQDALTGGPWFHVSNTFSYIYLTFFILTPFILLFGLFLNYGKIENSADVIFVRRFSSVITELKQDQGFQCMIYYPLFTLNRLAYGFSQVSFNEFPVFQRSSNLVFSCAVFFYLLIVRPFKDKIIMVSSIVTQGFISIIFAEVLVMWLRPDALSEETFDVIFISVLMICFASHYLVAFIILVKDIKSIIIKVKLRRVEKVKKLTNG